MGARGQEANIVSDGLAARRSEATPYNAYIHMKRN